MRTVLSIRECGRDVDFAYLPGARGFHAASAPGEIMHFAGLQGSMYAHLGVVLEADTEAEAGAAANPNFS